MNTETEAGIAGTASTPYLGFPEKAQFIIRTLYIRNSTLGQYVNIFIYIYKSISRVSLSQTFSKSRESGYVCFFNVNNISPLVPKYGSQRRVKGIMYG